MDKEMLDILNDLSKKTTTELALQIMELSGENLILEQQCKKQRKVIDKAIEKINDYKIYCEENKGFTNYTDIEIEAIEPVISKFEDILNEVSE